MCDFGNCSERISNPIIVLKQKGIVCNIVNCSRLDCLKVEVDGCLDLRGVKCDYLVIKLLDNHALYIELKGQDVSHAFRQLKNSMEQIEANNSPYIDHPFYKRECYVIAHRCPMSSPEIQKEALKFKRDYKSSLTVKKSGFRIQI